MAVKIDQISVKGQQPLSNFDQRLGLVNLIYGHNETGKTLLVEFIYRALFKNNSLQNMRDDFKAMGKVVVSGVEPKPLEFSTIRQKKLDEYWQESDRGLPIDFSKLLVVRAAELELASTGQAGIDENTLRKFLSGEDLIDEIAGRIGKTEANTSYKDGVIVGNITSNTMKSYSGLLKTIRNQDSLLEMANKKLTVARRYEIVSEIAAIQQEIDLQIEAKKHKAYELKNEFESLQNKVDAISMEDIKVLSDDLLKYDENIKRVAEYREEIREATTKSKHFNWLKDAIEKYEVLKANLEKTDRTEPKNVEYWKYISIFIFATVGFSGIFINNNYFIGIGFLFAIGFALSLGQSKSTSKSLVLDQTEFEIIRNGFKEKFAAGNFVGKTDLDSKLDEIRPYYSLITTRQADLQKLEGENDSLRQEIGQYFRKLQGNIPSEDQWHVELDKTRTALSKYQNTKKDIEVLLAALNVLNVDLRKEKVISSTGKAPFLGDSLPTSRTKILRLLRKKGEGRVTTLFPIDWSKILQPEEDASAIDSATEVLFDGDYLAKLQASHSAKQGELADLDKSLYELIVSISKEVKEPESIPLPALISKLEDLREENLGKIRADAAIIHSMRLVNEALTSLKNIEAKRIEENLESDLISKNLYATTGKYDRIQKVQSDFLVGNNYGDFSMKNMSTGTKQQILLGLRTGFASRAVGNEPMFLILDDAFQHSDWERRKYLMNHISSLAEKGWQIIYFSMDDHIKRLFEDHFRPLLGDEFKSITLNG